MAYIKAKDGTELFYYDWGTGDPVILIHGWPLTSASWEAQARYLADSGYRVIAYDKRGFGRSDWPNDGYNYDTLAEDLSSIIETLNLNQLTLVGFSMGGGEVARYIAKFGEQHLKKAVFIASVTPFLLKTADNPEGIEAKIFKQMEEKINQDRPDFFKNFATQFYNHSLLNHTVSDAYLDFFRAMAMAASPKATVELMQAWSTTDFRADLSKITIPSLIIHGSKDQAVPIEKSAYLTAKLIKNCKIIEYENQSHGLITTAYKQLNSDLLNFLK